MREWPWGNTWQDGLCNTAESGLQETSPVGQFSPQGDSPYGLADMAGNVWEWSSSLLASFPYAATDGREDSLAAGERVLRGGAIGLSRVKARCAFRTGAQPEEYGFTIGFRIVMASLPESQRGDT